jgi:hypothetical protein
MSDDIVPDQDGRPDPEDRAAVETRAAESRVVKIHGPLRASDSERDDALHALAAHYADGRLERAEFDERAEVALAARTRDQLHALFADLPGPVPVPSSRPEPVPAAPHTSDRTSEAAAARMRQRPVAGFPPIVLSPVLFVVAIVAVLYGAPPFPLIPLVFILTGGPRRWNGQARPWN